MAGQCENPEMKTYLSGITKRGGHPSREPQAVCLGDACSPSCIDSLRFSTFRLLPAHHPHALNLLKRGTGVGWGLLRADGRFVKHPKDRNPGVWCRLVLFEPGAILEQPFCLSFKGRCNQHKLLMCRFSNVCVCVSLPVSETFLARGIRYPFRGWHRCPL